MQIPGSIFTKVVILLLSGTLTFTFVVETYSYLQIKDRGLQTLKTDLENNAARLSNSLIHPIWNIDEEELDHTLALEMADRNIYAIVVRHYDRTFFKGKIRDEGWAAVPFDPDRFNETDLARRFRNKTLPIFRGTEKIGFVTIYVTDRFVRRDIREFFSGLVLHSLMLSAISFLVIFLSLKRMVIDPIRELDHTVQKFSSEDMSARCPVRSRDEIGRLGESFNHMADQLKGSFERIEEDRRLLEIRVEERTKDLKESLEKLKQTQQQLVQSEKMASLGELVAGVAHEINTPVGIGITASSYLQRQTGEIMSLFAENRLKRSALEEYLNSAAETCASVLTNLNKASELIQTFKQVSVDQTLDELRSFRVKEYLEEILFSLRPKYRHTNFNVELEGPDDLEMNSYPGPLMQILTNLVMNSLIHGFEGREAGVMSIKFFRDGDHLSLTYGDDGIGMNEEHVKRIYDPFFTTKRGKGGTGLGMHIVYNLVTRKLRGRITCHSVPGEGTTFSIYLPLDLSTVPEKA